VVFIAFAGEEAGKKGSKYYIDHPGRFPVDQTIGMLNLDTIGRLQKGKLLVIGGSSAREWAHIFQGAGYVTGVGVTMVPEDLDSSDQASFHAAGVPAVQLFTGPHLDYHKPTDTADKIDAEGLLKVADVAKEAVVYLANRQEFLSIELKREGKASQSGEKTARKVSLGTMPDFAFQGAGYRLSGVVPGSPAETAGLQEGDIIIRVGETGINGMQDLSAILQKLSPGETITVIYKRGEREIAAAIAPIAK
jgi:Zn-dependent M28 family amino/carboxypeptidase